MRHADIWRGIDLLAARHDLSASALARASGLDPTAFNKSKRFARDGKPRWPSTESLAKAIDAVGTSFEEFVDLVEGRTGRAVPLLGLAQAGSEGFFDDAGFPAGEGWDRIRFPGLEDQDVYALEITGQSMEPVYREGDQIIVSPGQPVRRGDRVVAKLRSGEVMAKWLARQTDTKVVLNSFNPEFPPIEARRADILWMARILWASQ